MPSRAHSSRGARNADLLHGSVKVSAVLDDNRDQLHPDERGWLTEVWPALAGSHAPEGDSAPPDRQLLGQPMFEDHRDEPDPEEDEMWDEFVRQALGRAQRLARGTPR